LYVLGDLFDLWVGDDADLPDGGPVADALAALGRAGTAVYLMHGNHDFLLGDAFLARASAHLLPDPVPLTLGPERVLLAHGDALCTDDVEYQAFRAHIRAPQTLAQLARMPLAERRALGERIRQASRTETARKAPGIMDLSTPAALGVLEQHGATVLLHGHTHRPGVRTLDAVRRRITLGSWEAGPNAAWWNGYAWGGIGIPGL
jgi:UDP-2,3-diacylglucosamine hydrolase